MITWFADHIMANEFHLPTREIAELQNQFNCNGGDEFSETWFDEEIPVAHTSVIDEDEFFNRYFGEDYDC